MAEIGFRPLPAMLGISLRNGAKDVNRIGALDKVANAM